MKIRLRKFSADDTTTLLSLFYDTVHGVNNKDYPPEHLDAWAPLRPDIKKWKERFKSSETIVAELDGKIVGFGNILMASQGIDMLYVHKDHQEFGIATAILKKLEKKLRKKNIGIATVEASITAKPFFEKKGYRVVRENRKMLNGIEFLNFIMEKALTLKDQDSMKDKPKDKKSFHWRDLFINKFFDLLMVIFGVTIAFQLNNLKLESDQKSLERFYLESMRADLDKDIIRCKQILRDVRSDRKLIINCLKKLEQPNPSPDSLGIVIFEVANFETFTGNQDTYTTLLTSNGFSALGDRAIRNQITEYYKTYSSAERFDRVYTELVFRSINFFSPYCDYAKRKVVDESVVSMVQTRNLLLFALGQLNGGFEDYTEMVAKAEALKKNIDFTIQK